MCLPLMIERPSDVLSSGEHVGFEWVTMHNRMGYRCGYVRVPIEHPWHGKGWDEVHVRVHGGITYAQADEICEKPGPDEAWWLGFDCAHGYDSPDPTLPGARCMPGDEFSVHPSVIRTQAYVEGECASLCEQLAEVLPNSEPAIN